MGGSSLQALQTPQYSRKPVKCKTCGEDTGTIECSLRQGGYSVMFDLAFEVL